MLVTCSRIERLTEAIHYDELLRQICVTRHDRFPELVICYRVHDKIGFQIKIIPSGAQHCSTTLTDINTKKNQNMH